MADVTFHGEEATKPDKHGAHRGMRNLAMILSVLLQVSCLISSSQATGTSEVPAPTSSPELPGVIDSQLFQASTPRVMTLGKTYRLKVVARNTGDVTADYAVILLENSTSYWMEHFYLQQWTEKFTLKPGERHSVEFRLVPVLPHAGPLPIVARLYRKTEEKGFVQIDSAWSYVSEIGRDFPIEALLGMIAIVFVALVFVKVRPRRELLILVALFSISILLRGLTLPNVAVYADEVSMQRYGFQILAEEWQWPKWLMWIHPPFESYISAATTSFFGSQVEAHRWTSAIPGALTICVLYLFGKAIFDKRTGLLSALLFTISSYFLYWTCLLRAEALTILFLVACCYFFWRGLRDPNKRRNMIIAGVFFGLCFHTLYVAVVLIPAFLAFLLWFRGRWRPVSRNDLIAFLASSLLVTVPLLVTLYVGGANPFWWHLFGRSQAARPIETPFVSIGNIVAGGVNNYVGILVWRGEVLWWFPIFSAASLLLLLGACVYYGYSLLLRKRPSEGFLTAVFVMLLLFSVLYQLREQHLLLYSFPFLIVMIANLAVRATDSLRTHVFSGGLDVLKLVSLILTGIFVFSSACIVAVQPVVEKGQDAGLQETMTYLRMHGKSGDRVATLFGLIEARYADQIDLNIDFVFVPLLTVEVRSPPGEPRLSPWIVDLDRLRILRPQFIVIQRSHYDFYFNLSLKKELSQSYRLVLDTGPETIGGVMWRGRLVFERLQPVAFEVQEVIDLRHPMGYVLLQESVVTEPICAGVRMSTSRHGRDNY